MTATKRVLDVVTANRGRLLVASTFSGYDTCLNPYVGCEFGCCYCYVRWFIKDKQYDWGEFVRVRDYLKEKLPRELLTGRVPAGKPAYAGNKDELPDDLPLRDARLVFGTMTDPYQPVERDHRVMRMALDILLRHPVQFKKVGIFTRSPIVLDDVDRIVRLPNKRVHFTVTPLDQAALKLIEPIAIPHVKRFAVIRALKAAGIRVHINVAPALPVYSDHLTAQMIAEVAAVRPAEFFVDPIQPYGPALAALATALKDDPSWPHCHRIMTTPKEFQAWKDNYRATWTQGWRAAITADPTLAAATLPIWSDHVHHSWVDMRTDAVMSKRLYGDEKVA